MFFLALDKKINQCTWTFWIEQVILQILAGGKRLDKTQSEDITRLANVTEGIRESYY